jgi:hypothetical protein
MRIFDRAEATALLPHLRPLVTELLAARRAVAIALLEAQAAARLRHGPEAERVTMDDTLQEAQLQLVRLVERIQTHGCIVKDVDLGLLDFPSLRDGEIINLCWKLGETEVAFWHGLDEGFVARKPIAETRL